MLAKRIIPCLDVDDGRVVKGIRFVSLVDAGDPVEQAKRYDTEGADELTFLDITASSARRDIVAGLGLLKGRVRQFGDDLVVPHVGWNQVRRRASHSLFEGIADQSFFYFVHSFYCEPKDDGVSIGETDYGATYASVVAFENVCGVQFHPEKSQGAGLRLLQNFADVYE